MKNPNYRKSQPGLTVMEKFATLTRNVVSMMRQTTSVACACAAIAMLSPATHAAISEPETVFYGKIVNRTWGQPFLVTTGSVSCVISVPSAAPLTVVAPLQSLADGAYSYQMRIPHEALSQGLLASTNVIPLLADPARLTFLQFTVNGSMARVLAPTSSQIQVAQANRAATYRLDLEVFDPLADTDGDGIPDWWEQKYGLDPFFAGDANLDKDGDGWSNLVEFRKGTDPTKDDRTPSLQQTDLIVYADGTSALLPKAVDADSSATQLIYTIQALPQFGRVLLRNTTAGGTNSDATLNVGSKFTQDDVDHCRVLYVQSGNSTATIANLSVSVADENTNHTAATATLKLTIIRPGDLTVAAQIEAVVTNTPSLARVTTTTTVDQLTTLNYLLSRDLNYIIADASGDLSGRTIQAVTAGLTADQYQNIYIPAYGKDRSHVLIGGSASDRLVGGMEGDILIANGGNDTMRGNGGADTFVFNYAGFSTNVVEDFSIADNDVLDLSHLFDSTPGMLTNYVNCTTNGADSVIGINFDGNGSKFTNMTITLKGVQTSLSQLDAAGLLVGGAKVMTPKVSIAATQPAASQNGPVVGVFTVTRTGSLASAMTVNLTISGSAVNGSDYQLVASTVTISAGSTTTNITINPYITASGYSQVAQIAVAAGTGYEIGTNNVAQVSIEPLAAQITIEALNPVAEKSSMTPGVFLVTRGGLADRSVLVRLQISGSASSNLDYVAIPAFVNFAAQQTTALINVTPKSTASVANGAKDVVVSIKTDPSYKVMTPSSARVFVVDQLMDLTAWQEKYFSSSTADITTFALSDAGNKGVRNIYRYAFGLDPVNPQLSTNAPTAKVKNNYLTLSFREPESVTDLDYIVEVSNDMKHWRSTASDVQLDPTATNSVEQVTYRSTTPMSQASTQYMRVRLQFKD